MQLMPIQLRYDPPSNNAWSQEMILVTPQKIASVMGLSHLPRSLGELDDLVRQGLPKTALRASVDHVGRTAKECRRLLFCIIPITCSRQDQDRLTPDESEKTERLARVFATALHVWDDAADAREFLHTPHRLLGERSPLDVAMTELGARRVEELLWQLFYGLPVDMAAELPQRNLTLVAPFSEVTTCVDVPPTVL
jgi:putative toxin-antitoxin system antitoxin component (TIGR02293 family)